MKLRAVFWLVAAFVISFFAVGFPYWQIPYAKVSLPSTLYDTGLLVVGVLAAAARAVGIIPQPPRSKVVSARSLRACWTAFLSVLQECSWATRADPRSSRVLKWLFCSPLGKTYRSAQVVLS